MMVSRWAALLVAVSVTTAAAAEGESSLSIGAGYGNFAVPLDRGEASGDGVMLTGDYQHLFGDTWGVRASAGGGLFSAGGKRSYGGLATAGVVYLVDVLKYVPYVDLCAGAMLVGGGAIRRRVDAVLEVGAGVDVIQSPTWSWGIDLQLGAFASQARAVTLEARMSWRWGYF